MITHMNELNLHHISYNEPANTCIAKRFSGNSLIYLPYISTQSKALGRAPRTLYL